jgi:hypothetical protein
VDYGTIMLAAESYANDFIRKSIELRRLMHLRPTPQSTSTPRGLCGERAGERTVRDAGEKAGAALAKQERSPLRRCLYVQDAAECQVNRHRLDNTRDLHKALLYVVPDHWIVIARHKRGSEA